MQFYNRETSLTFDDAVLQLLSEESRLQDMKGVEESSAYTATQSKAPAVNPPTQPTPQFGKSKKGPTKNRENLWCNYCKRRGHTKETFWKLQNRTPQAHIMSRPYQNQGEMPGNQQWMQNYTPPSYTNNPQPPTNPSNQMNSHQMQEVRNLPQQVQNLQQPVQNLQTPTQAESVMGSTSIANSGKQPILSALSSISSSKSYQNTWILDSGATDHMTLKSEGFVSYEPCVTGKSVQTADGTLLEVSE